MEHLLCARPRAVDGTTTQGLLSVLSPWEGSIPQAQRGWVSHVAGLGWGARIRWREKRGALERGLGEL